jgi:hypothetical protein
MRVLPDAVERSRRWRLLLVVRLADLIALSDYASQGAEDGADGRDRRTTCWARTASTLGGFALKTLRQLAASLCCPGRVWIWRAGPG